MAENPSRPHERSTSSRQPNHLINETSPYLLAHAYNPVNWYPWGEEALQKSRDENKLIFLSIGYHSCHWCHVMETESFEDKEVAAVLNTNYVCIKVDRGERKDLDAVYMKVCQTMTGSGGWPLNVWLTPDRLPVYAGTYFPKHNYMNRLGLIETATQLSDLFRENPLAITEKSFEIIKNLKKYESNIIVVLNPGIINDVNQNFKEEFDPVNGGFSKAPKFPAHHQLIYLLESEDELLINMGLKTIEQMIKGGIYDHIGGGFSRYSVDEKWLIPHFEKMLYDNALLLDVLCKAYEVSGNKSFKTVAMEIKTFMKNELAHDSGGFYSEYDADSEGIEGKYYRFTKGEILQVLGNADGNLFCQLYGVTDKGNFEGFTIINLLHGKLDTINSPEIKVLRNKLLQYRNQRIKPALDDKILSMCNGFAVFGLAAMYEVFEDAEALQMAVSTEKYIEERMMKTDSLLVSVRNDAGNINGTIDDYSACIRGLLKLFAVTQDDSYLEKGLSLIDMAIKKFWDNENGGFFIGEQNENDLIFNPKDLYDGAIPSGNSMMASNFLHAFLLTEDMIYNKYLDEMITFFSSDLNRYKIQASFFMGVIRSLHAGVKELKIYVKDFEMKNRIVKEYSAKRLNSLHKNDIHRIIINKDKCINQLPTVHFCENGACSLPKLLTEYKV